MRFTVGFDPQIWSFGVAVGFYADGFAGLDLGPFWFLFEWNAEAE